VPFVICDSEIKLNFQLIVTERSRPKVQLVGSVFNSHNNGFWLMFIINEQHI